MNTITWSDFEKIEIRIGTVITGALSAGLVGNAFSHSDCGGYTSLLGNFPPKQIANFFSECLVLGSVDADGIVTLLQTERLVENGLRIA